MLIFFTANYSPETLTQSQFQNAWASSFFTLNLQRIKDVGNTMDIGNLASNTRQTDACNERRTEAKEVYDVIVVQCQERFRFSDYLDASRLLDSNNFDQFYCQISDTVVNNIASLYPSLDKYSRVNLYSLRALQSHFAKS